jgi:trimeric autotransporter adhesin
LRDSRPSKWTFAQFYLTRLGNGERRGTAQQLAVRSSSQKFMPVDQASQRCQWRHFAAIGALLIASAAHAQTTSFTYQGVLRNAGNLINGPTDLRVAVFDAASGGTEVGAAQTFNDVNVVNGVFTLPLDFGALYGGGARYLEVRVGDGAGVGPSGSFTTLAPRQELRAVPIATTVPNDAIGADEADETQVQLRVSGTCAVGSSIREIDAAGAVSCEPNNGGDGWSLSGNAGTVPATNFVGTTDNQALELRSNNARVMRLEAIPLLLGPGFGFTANLIGGSPNNLIDAGVRGATIAGGGAPEDSEPGYATEAPNRVSDHYSTVSGGFANLAGDGMGLPSNAAFATVGGGRLNTAFGERSTVSGGFANMASGTSSVVSGGFENVASGSNSMVGGGFANMASGTASVVSGGFENLASGSNSTVGGGTENAATGRYSTAVGGLLNCAGGDLSWAGGRGALVRVGSASGDGSCADSSGDSDGDEGSFVWADAQFTPFQTTGPGQFLVRAAGGVAINTNSPSAGAALTVNGNVAITATGSLNFGSETRQMLNLWGPASYGIGVQNARLYFRTDDGFAWHQDGTHSDATDDPGASGTLRMRLSSTGALQTSTGTISALSDARTKHSVRAYENALDHINRLQPVYFQYRDVGKAPFRTAGEHLGFIAQDVQQVFPNWVQPDPDGWLTLTMRGFEAVAVRALQELDAKQALADAELANLRAENQQLRAKLAGQAGFEARLRALEVRLNLSE